MRILICFGHALVGLLLLLGAGCAGTGFNNDYTLDYVPVDDVGGAGGYSYLEEPVALDEPVRQGSAPRAPEAPAARTVKAAPRASAPRSGRTMQTATIPGLELSQSVPAFAPAQRRFTQSSQQRGEHYEPEELEPRTVPAARITHVNLGDKYVILKCEKRPQTGEDARIYRNGEQVGIVRFVSSRRGQYIVADIVEGQPQRGDIAQYEILFPR
jgi:hypothetical protein